MASSARKTGTRFMPSTPAEFLALPPGMLSLGLFAFGVLDLAAYASKTALLEAARVATKKKGRINREIARAENNGYYVRPFQLPDFPEDLVAIHRSKSQRDGRPVNDAYYNRTAAEFSSLERMEKDCPQHHHVTWGVFIRDDGHTQNGRVTGERLVAYVSVARRGECAWYNAIMGHAEHLHSGVMYLLHYHIASDAIATRPPGLRYIAFYTLVRGLCDAAARWKYNCLFKPVYFHYVGDRPVLVPDDHILTQSAAALDLLEQSVGLPQSDAEMLARYRGFSLRHLNTLHQIWVALKGDKKRIAALLRAGPHPPLDLLRALAPATFPTEVLDGVTRAAVALSGRCRGLDTLLPLLGRGIGVSVRHSNPHELQALKTTYDAPWTFEVSESPPSSFGADVVICDAGFATRENLRAMFCAGGAKVLVAARPELMEEIHCAKNGDLAQIGQSLSAYTGRQVRCRKTFFRCGHPDEQTWLWIETGPASGE